MFQFPGFALKTLCIQVLSTCLRTLLISMADNNELSGGFPHSEILGSKPILGSPKLIAEYHVLHRLLLPRHPPNALLALDLIQKETDRSDCPTALRLLEGKTSIATPGWFDRRHLFLDQKHTIPPEHTLGLWCCSGQEQHLVSVLDLDNTSRFSQDT